MTSATTVQFSYCTGICAKYEARIARTLRSPCIVSHRRVLSSLLLHFCNIKTTHSLIRLPVPRGRHHSLNCQRKLDHLQCPFSFEKKCEDLENGICGLQTLEGQV